MNSSNYYFRRAQENDSEIIFSFLQDLANHEGKLSNLKITQEKLHQALSTNNSKIKALICEHGSLPIGTAIWCERFSPYAGGTNLLLIDLYVAPDYRKNGLGRKFIAELQNIAKNENYVRIEWFVDKDNQEAKQFYTKLGGKRIEHSEHWKLEI